MAENTILGLNKKFPIYYDVNGAKTPFHDLALRKSTVESIVMSLGDKISGDVYYKDNSLVFTMQEYIEYEGVKYVLVNPPTIVREGLVKDNSQQNGMTKYSLTFYHPMYMLSNFPFTDIAVTQDEENYLSQDKTFSWIGNLFDFIAKLNANLETTEWLVVTNFSEDSPSDEGDDIGDLQEDAPLSELASSSSSSIWEDEDEWDKASKLSEVLTFDKQFVSDALKTAYDTWQIPFIIDQITDAAAYVDNPFYNANKRFVISFGLPTKEIYASESDRQMHENPFVFKFGQGVGLKNNSRTPRNNKIVTRIVGYGSERNIPYGYPQIIWSGNPDWEYTYETSGIKEITIDGETVLAQSYPIYDGIVGGQRVKLIKHPFTRKTLMPSIYADCVNRKVNPNATGYDPRTEIIDYYDAVSGDSIQYPNLINPLAPSVDIHQFEDIYPRLGEAHIYDAYPIDATKISGGVVVTQTISSFITYLNTKKEASSLQDEKRVIQNLIDALGILNVNDSAITYWASHSRAGDAYQFSWSVEKKGGKQDGLWVVFYESATFNVSNANVIVDRKQANLTWDDTIDENGEYIQSYFLIVLPQLSFDLYACASITEQMQINMLSGACQGCTFDVQVDWDDYKRNFYDSDGNFAPTGAQRDYTKYPDSRQGSIGVIVQKDLNTFGTLMPNRYQYPKGYSANYDGDTFVFLGISLPLSYITTAQGLLYTKMKQYMFDNNVYYFDYPLKFDEHFLITHPYVLSQIRNNNLVRFLYDDVVLKLYIKQVTIKYGDSPLPQWDITLTDDVAVVLNKIGQVVEDVSHLYSQINELDSTSNAPSTSVAGTTTQGRGNTGRFYYYAGSWSNNNLEWVVNETQAPYFDYTFTTTDEDENEQTVTEYWLFNPPTSGAYTQSQMGEPKQGAYGWERMTSDFKFLITEAVFGKFAHFGSAIISGDWLISQHGTINGIASTEYTAFDPEHPNDNIGTNFIPNYCVDLKTGASYQQNAYIKGEIHSSSGEIGGFVISPSALTNYTASRGNKIQIESTNSDFYAAIGGVDVPSANNDVLYGARISSDFVAHGVDTLNVAIRARASNEGGAKGFALHGEGHIITTGAVCGYFPNFADMGTALEPSVIDLNMGNKVILSSGHIFLPRLSNLRSALKIDDRTAFAVELILIFNGSSATVYGRQQNQSDNEFPIFRDNNYDWVSSHTFSLGRVVTFMLTWTGEGSSYDARILSYSDKNL